MSDAEKCQFVPRRAAAARALAAFLRAAAACAPLTRRLTDQPDRVRRAYAAWRPGRPLAGDIAMAHLGSLLRRQRAAGDVLGELARVQVGELSDEAAESAGEMAPDVPSAAQLRSDALLWQRLVEWCGPACDVASDAFWQRQAEHYSQFLATLHDLGESAAREARGPPFPVDVVFHAHMLEYEQYVADTIERVGFTPTHRPMERDADGAPTAAARRAAAGRTDQLAARFVEMHGTALDACASGFDATAAGQLLDPLFVPAHVLDKIVLFHAQMCADSAVANGLSVDSSAVVAAHALLLTRAVCKAMRRSAHVKETWWAAVLTRLDKHGPSADDALDDKFVEMFLRKGTAKDRPASFEAFKLHLAQDLGDNDEGMFEVHVKSNSKERNEWARSLLEPRPTSASVRAKFIVGQYPTGSGPIVVIESYDDYDCDMCEGPSDESL